jgi:uncharacterized delta-60 repeat protein
MRIDEIKTSTCIFCCIGKMILVIIIPLMVFSQTERWVYQYNGSIYDFLDAAYSVTYGADGNIYAAGFSKDTTWRDDFAVISLDQNGAERWVYRYHAPGSTSNMARSLVFGEDGNVYVVGNAHSMSFDDLLVISLDQNGIERWIYRSDSTVDHWDEVSSIIYGADGNLYIAGRNNIPGSWGNFTIMSLDTNGNERWKYRYNGSGNQSDWAEAIVYGLDGNLYAAGRTWESSTADDITVISLDQNGVERWVYQYNGPANGIDRAHSITYGLDGNVYVAGESELNGSDFVVISLDQNGIERWIYRYNASANNCDIAYSLVYGSDGNIYVSGTSCDSSYDFVVASLDQNGTERWVYRYDRPGSNRGCAHSVLYGLDNNIYAAGYSYGIGTDDDITVISLDQNGTERWVYWYNGSANSEDWSRSAAYGLDGNIYVAGYVTDEISSMDFTVLSLDPITGIEEEKALVRASDYGTTIISGPLLLPEGKNCRVIDIMGRVTELDQIKPGIYFIEVDGKIKQKVIKIE